MIRFHNHAKTSNTCMDSNLTWATPTFPVPMICVRTEHHVMNAEFEKNGVREQDMVTPTYLADNHVMWYFV